MRRVGVKSRQQRTANFLKGNPGNSKRKSYLAILIPCAVIFFVFLLFQRPQQGKDGTLEQRLASGKGDRLQGGSSSSSRNAAGGIRGAAANASGGSGSATQASLDALRCAVVIDAGSTGSRVHAFKFEANGATLDLLDSAFKAIEPGLSSFAENPDQAGQSLIPLLEEAKAFVPADLYAETTVELRATAGLRMLEHSAVTAILEEVHNILQSYPFKVMDDAVSVMEGADEGVFMWVSSNYYLGNIGKPTDETASVIDLGGGSVQRAFAVTGPFPESLSENAIRTISAGGKAYDVYVHSYLGYGLKASRMTFLKPFDNVEEGHPCMTKGYLGRYHYVDENVSVKSDEEEGADVDKCIGIIKNEMELDEDCGVVDQCSFSGVWSGGTGGGQNENYVSSYIVDIARDVGVIPRSSTKSSVTLDDFKQAAEKVCAMEFESMAATYGHYLNNDSDLPFMCMDVLYSYTLLKDGFSLDEGKAFTVVKQFDYRGKKVEAAWPLGAAINTLGKFTADEVKQQENAFE